MTTTPVSPRVRIPFGSVQLEGVLEVPPGARGLVMFAHGSGSGRLSPRNQLVARALRETGLATLLFDLLTEQEAPGARFDIDLLTRRLLGATDWIRQSRAAAVLALGYFGASTGAAAALRAGAERRSSIGAIVSRGGRPDLAGDVLERVTAPTLLIVGERDEVVVELNRAASERLGGHRELAIVPCATHLFEEPGALEEVARLAARWFRRYLAR
jgi:pimeloyl-ACP methyl ester carboxylesterase